MILLLKSVGLISLLGAFGFLLFPKRSNNYFLVLGTSVGAGLIFLTSISATIFTFGATMLAPFALLFLGLIFRNLRNSNRLSFIEYSKGRN